MFDALGAFIKGMFAMIAFFAVVLIIICVVIGFLSLFV